MQCVDIPLTRSYHLFVILSQFQFSKQKNLDEFSGGWIFYAFSMTAFRERCLLRDFCQSNIHGYSSGNLYCNSILKAYRLNVLASFHQGQALKVMFSASVGISPPSPNRSDATWAAVRKSSVMGARRDLSISPVVIIIIGISIERNTS